MKKNLFLFVPALLVCNFVFAQISIDTDTLTMPEPDPSEVELILYNHVQNESGGQLDMNWTRVTNDLNTDLSSSVCLGDLCYSPTTNSGTFTLDAGEKLEVSCHLWNTISDPNPMGLVEVILADDNNPNTTAAMTFIYGAYMSSSIDEVTAAKVKFYPNPTTNYFQLENSDWVDRVEIVNLNGSIVRSFTSNNGQYDIANLSQGGYYALLRDSDGIIGRVIKFQKQ